jgi:hypothetical protein
LKSTGHFRSRSIRKTSKLHPEWLPQRRQSCCSWIFRLARMESIRFACCSMQRRGR